jgi:hypothetical protein
MSDLIQWIPGSCEIIQVHISEINPLIKESSVYKDLFDGVFRKLQTRENPSDFSHPLDQHPEQALLGYAEEENDLISIPKKYYFKNIRQLLRKSLSKVLHILRYWNINPLPYKVISNAFNNIKEDIINLNEDLINYFCEISVIINSNNKTICSNAAKIGSLNLLKVAHKNDCPWDEDTFIYAAEGGYLNCLIYLHENNCPYDESACDAAAGNGHLECLKYLHENGYQWNEIDICRVASTTNHLDCLIYAHQNGAIFCEWIYWDTRKMGHTDCLEYIEQFIPKI